MAINWTPWFDVPLHRRLELLSIGLVVFCEVVLGPICVFIILCLLVIHFELEKKTISRHFERPRRFQMILKDLKCRFSRVLFL